MPSDELLQAESRPQKHAVRQRVQAPECPKPSPAPVCSQTPDEDDALPDSNVRAFCRNRADWAGREAHLVLYLATRSFKKTRQALPLSPAQVGDVRHTSRAARKKRSDRLGFGPEISRGEGALWHVRSKSDRFLLTFRLLDLMPCSPSVSSLACGVILSLSGNFERMSCSSKSDT